MNIDPEMFGAELGKVIREAIDRRFAVLDEKIRSLEDSGVVKSLDAEAYGELAAIAERLERMETAVGDIAEHGFRYRGYWEVGTRAARGDAYTHNGSLWYSLRETKAEPSKHSADWNVAARKGVDAR